MKFKLLTLCPIFSPNQIFCLFLFLSLRTQHHTHSRIWPSPDPRTLCISHLAELNKLKVIPFKNFWWEVGASTTLIASWELTGFTDVPQIYPTFLCTNELSWRLSLLTFKWVYLAHCSVYLNEHCFGALKLNDLLCIQVREGGMLWHSGRDEDIWNTCLPTKNSCKLN